MSGRRGTSGSGSGRDPTARTDATVVHCSSCTVSSQTVSTARANRQRTTVGVAERVTLTISPSGAYTWSVSGGGTLSATSGNSVEFTAPETGGTSVITAQGAGCSCSITVRVVQPNGAHQVQHDGTLHTNGVPSVGFMGITYLEPADVSFENIEVIEGTCPGVGTGAYAAVTDQHPEWTSGWATVAAGTDATGSSVQGPNHQATCVYWDYVWSAAFLGAGTFEWRIPWIYRVNGGTRHPFTTLVHREVWEASGRGTMSKGGVSVSASPGDATNAP